MLKLVSFHIQTHLNAFLQILEYFSQSVEVDGLNLLAYSVFELFDCVECIFCTLYPSIGPKERSRQALDRLPLVYNFLTNFWVQNFDVARLSPNSVWNAVWHALNEPVYQYLRTRTPRCSIVYINNSLGPLARDSPCIIDHLSRKFVSDDNFWEKYSFLNFIILISLNYKTNKLCNRNLYPYLFLLTLNIGL